jgi:hypothetical protein
VIDEVVSLMGTTTADWKLRVAERLIATLTGEWGLRPSDILDDFLTFKALMRKRNKELELEAIRELQREFPKLAESCAALGVTIKGPCQLKIDVLTEKEEAALGLRGSYAGISLKKKEEGTVIPAIACRGDIYFRKGDSIVCLEDFIEAARRGYIIASRLEPDFDWDGEDEAPEITRYHKVKKAELIARKNSPSAINASALKIRQALM